MCFCLHPHPNAPSVSNEDTPFNKYANNDANLDIYNAINWLVEVNSVICLQDVKQSNL
jgi:hypothetical protein